MLLACSSEPEPGREDDGAPASPTDSGADFRGQVYGRTVVFMTSTQDLELILPFSFSARTAPGGVRRRSRGWLAREGSWDPFYSVTWETPRSRAPWRILPRPPLRILVGDGDALERFIYEEGPRYVEVAFGSTLVDWSGQRGETFRLQEAEILFSGRNTGGILLDLAWAREAGEPVPGDWAFLASGDSVHIVIEDPGREPDPRDSPPEEEGQGAYRAWARFDFRDTQWPGVSVTWTETRSYEEARREVPVAWSLSTGDGELEGSLEVLSAWLERGEGSGPLLPVEALYEVRGDVRIQGRDYPVRGLFRHAQP